MRELALHILDIIMNSIEAGATRVILVIMESVKNNGLTIVIRDNGRGMPPDLIETVHNPFMTTRTSREVGMGISLFKQAAERCDGYLDIKSQVGRGTTVSAFFKLNHLDRSPLGNIEETLTNLIVGSPDVHFVYLHKTDNRRFCFDSYWMFARMDEWEKSLYEMVAPAQDHLVALRHKIDSVA